MGCRAEALHVGVHRAGCYVKDAGRHGAWLLDGAAHGHVSVDVAGIAESTAPT